MEKPFAGPEGSEPGDSVSMDRKGRDDEEESRLTEVKGINKSREED